MRLRRKVDITLTNENQNSNESKVGPIKKTENKGILQGWALVLVIFCIFYRLSAFEHSVWRFILCFVLSYLVSLVVIFVSAIATEVIDVVVLTFRKTKEEPK